MKPILTILLFLSFFSTLHSQANFRTVVSRRTILAGESFQVQYILQDPEKFTDFYPPDFSQFRIVTGPNTYTGTTDDHNKTRQVKNVVYTLSALYAGHYVIPGATALFNNQLVHSNAVPIDVLTEDLKSDLPVNSEYILRPGEDPYEKIGKNLFVKVWVDRHSCFVGEPVEATFKLYSRLESKSDIVKNPGFYGFTVYDMVNLADKQVATENIKGKLFDVHTIRKVQLYPLREGSYTIDAMEVKNKVEFSRSTVNKKTEQQIVEGVLGNDNDAPSNSNTEVFETEIHTTPLTVEVKPLPVRNKPESFAGATGKFTITGTITREPLSKNAEGILELAIRGKGNFIQIDAPAIHWPAGIEGFEPQMKDSLDKTYTPLAGARIFRYAFVPAGAGTYTIPPIEFSFFNPDTGGYKSVSTDKLEFKVSNDEKKNQFILDEKPGHASGNTMKWWPWAILALVAAGLVGWGYRLRRNRMEQEAVQRFISANKFTVEKVLVPAVEAIAQDGPSFYQALQQSIWRFAYHHFRLSGSDSKKHQLLERLRAEKVPGPEIATIESVLTECEAGLFANEPSTRHRDELLSRVNDALGKIDSYLAENT